jgi:PAS domain S-box-containing protein
VNPLDMRTLVFGYVVTNILCVGIVVLLSWQSRDRFKGIALLVVDFIFQASALILIVLRGAIPDWISIVLSNTLVVAGAILGFRGQERFVEKKGINIASALLLVCFQSVWLMWHRVEPGLRSVTFGVGLVNFLYCLVSVVRILQFLIGVHLETDYFRSGLFEALVLVSYQVLFIMLTYSLVLMVNKRLFMEIETQEEKFAKAFHSAPYAITITRPSDGKIVEVNETFFSITGYDRTEVMGKNTVDLRLWEHDEDRAAVVDTLLKTGKVHGKEFRFRRKNGEAITGIFSADILTIEGEKSILSSIGDITERKQQTEELVRSDREKSVLLKEIHHRVKNNLQIIASLLRLNTKYSGNERVAEIFRESQDRIQAMATVHSMLYKSKNFTEINFGEYIQETARQLFRSYNTSPESISLFINADNIMLSIDNAIPCGLIINELVSNALKHAMPSGRKGEIRVEMRRDENGVRIIFADNGVGFPEGIDFRNTETLGLQLVNMLVAQLDGTIEMDGNGGTRYVITLRTEEEK